MGYICTRCGGTNVTCEAIVNPNTGEIIDYFAGAFMHAICSDCENEVVISNVEGVKYEIDLRFLEFVERTGKEPEYVECRIVTEKGRDRAEIVYEDNSSNCPLLVVIHSISVSADWFSATGKALSSANRLLLEVPEYTTFKDGEVLSNKDGCYIFILNTHGKYLTSFYASLNQKGILKIEDGLSAWENQIEKYRFATESERQKLVDALKASKEPKAKEYLKRFFGIEEKPKYDFKPFDKVPVRDEDDKEWHISLFAREIVDDSDGLPYKYECSNGTLWDYRIPFEGNGCLLETAENPEK